ncbi:MAG: AAA family ATPase [Gammaproteobacteria bacterium]|nr:AAA family ATPase [Gammaproteobacteria bacterium]NNL49615.1 AAA family ATPase [Woeseiaceae bacterium]
MLVTRSNTVSEAISSRLQEHADFFVTKKIISNGSSDPMHNVQSKQDVMLLHYAPGFGELEHLAKSTIQKRMPLIVLGPANDPEAMRLAMRAGASDYISQPVQQDELSSALRQVSDQLKDKITEHGKLIAVTNSKGGSGASFVATNLAYALNQGKTNRTILVDLDLQFGGLSRYLDLKPKRGVAEALEAADQMDEVSSEAYVTRHNSGLRLLAAHTERLLLSRDVPAENFDGLLQILQRNNDYVIADLPRRIDMLSAMLLERSDQILLVVQQSLAHINDAARMIHLLTKELAVPKDRIKVIANRYSKKSIIDGDDIKKALKIERIWIIPNQYQQVSESVDTGIPLMQDAKNSAAGKAIQMLEQNVRGIDSEESPAGLLGRALPSFLGRR